MSSVLLLLNNESASHVTWNLWSIKGHEQVQQGTGVSESKNLIRKRVKWNMPAAACILPLHGVGVGYGHLERIHALLFYSYACESPADLLAVKCRYCCAL
jgi:hypothetical protein